MPKAVEDCVKKISGMNKRTGKPYTNSEKWAICQAAHKKSKEKAEYTDAELIAAIEDVTALMEVAATRLFRTGKVQNMVQAYMMAEVLLARADYDVQKLDYSMRYLR